mmetsp:Transcript_61532/g.163711  ORF Transcript_61532/g.163711 Transcript_61532/m.163711 type:complete len:359 (+) Transcript_61532:51-1127(+)
MRRQQGQRKQHLVGERHPSWSRNTRATKSNLNPEGFLIGIGCGRSIAHGSEVAHLLVEGRHALELHIVDRIGSWRWPSVDTSEHQLGAGYVLDARCHLKTRMEHIVREKHCCASSRLKVERRQLQMSPLEVLIEVQHHGVDAALAIVVGIHTVTMFRKVFSRAVASDAEAGVEANWFPTPLNTETHRLQEVDVTMRQVRCQSPPQCTSESLAEMDETRVVSERFGELPLHVTVSEACRLGGRYISCCLRLCEQPASCEASGSQIFTFDLSSDVREQGRRASQRHMTAPSIVDGMYHWIGLVPVVVRYKAFIQPVHIWRRLQVLVSPLFRRICPLRGSVDGTVVKHLASFTSTSRPSRR